MKGKVIRKNFKGTINEKKLPTIQDGISKIFKNVKNITDREAERKRKIKSWRSL